MSEAKVGDVLPNGDKIVAIYDGTYWESTRPAADDLVLSKWDKEFPDWQEKPVFTVEVGKNFMIKEVSDFFGVPSEHVNDKLMAVLYKGVNNMVDMPHNYLFPANTEVKTDG